MQKDESKEKKNKNLGVVIGMAAFAIAFFVVQKLMKQDVAEELKKGAIELNKQAPVKVDNYTRLDSASSIGKTNFIYYYTLLEADKKEVNLDSVRKYIAPNIIKGVKEQPSLKIFRKNNITMDYHYFDKYGEFMIKVSVTPEMYHN